MARRQEQEARRKRQEEHEARRNRQERQKPKGKLQEARKRRQEQQARRKRQEGQEDSPADSSRPRGLLRSEPQHRASVVISRARPD